MSKNVKSLTFWRSVDRPDIEFSVVCDVIENVKCDKICGFFDNTGSFELDFRTIV